MKANRREFFKGIGASAMATAAFAGRPGFFSAHAADTSGYKALVCVFLFGGLDNYDLLVPYDTTSYGEFQAARPSLLSQYGSSRARSSLLALSPLTSSALGGRQVALPPEMPQLKSLFDAGNAAFVANVGPLIEPITLTQFQNGSARVPARLFSHNDQQTTWKASAPEGAQFGWAGLFADAVLAAGANGSSPQFTAITVDEAGPFLTGRQTAPYRISEAGAPEVRVFEELAMSSTPKSAEFSSMLRSNLGASQFVGTHVLEQDMALKVSNGLSTNDTFSNARASISPLSTAFGEGGLSAQLKAVAETISIRSQLSATRQVFFVGLGGFDTHSAQAFSLPPLLTELDSAIGAFQAAMAELGVVNDVTLFTASDFGRTLSVNGDGTDHGWGGNHIVVGGSVMGGDIYGSVAPPVLGNSLDTGAGRVIPSLAVEQYASQLGSWFGLTSSELATALPNLRNFDQNTPRFI
ncbi:MAG: DUF1501 domain-containing protein [Pseudomonadota bacterium]